MSTSLDKSERELLVSLERTIDDGKKTFIEVGNALLIVSRQKLWREAYESFEEYCKTRHGFKKSQAYRLIEASTVVKELSPIGENLNEAQCRALADVPKEQRAEVLTKAQEVAKEENRPLRAKDIENVAAPVKPEPVQPSPAQSPRAYSLRAFQDETEGLVDIVLAEFDRDELAKAAGQLEMLAAKLRHKARAKAMKGEA